MSGDTTVYEAVFNLDHEVLGIVRSVLHRPDVGPDDDIFDHGGTSLGFVRILAEIRQRYGATISPLALAAATPRELTRAVAAAGLGLASAGGQR